MKQFIIREKNKIILILIILSSLSFLDTIRKGLMNGCDFQWQPSKLLWSGVNHYEKFLFQGNSDFMCQGGQYAHGLHVILFPYTLFDWEIARLMWVITNILLAISIPLLICKKFKISKYKTIFILLIFLTCYPTRMNINYGQQSLLIMFFLILPFIFKSNFSYFLSGVSIFKYSTGYVIFFYYLIKKQYKNFFLATLPYIIGWIVYFMVSESEPIKNFFEPIQLILKTGYSRDGDIYSLFNNYVFSNLHYYYSIVLIILTFVLNIFFIIKANIIKNNLLLMSLICLCPLIFFPHSNYDYVLLLPLLIYSLSKFDLIINKLNFYFVMYYFFFNRLVKHLIDIDYIYQPFILSLLIIIYFLNIKYHEKKLSFIKII